MINKCKEILVIENKKVKINFDLPLKILIDDDFLSKEIKINKK